MPEFTRRDDSAERRRIDKIVEEQSTNKGPAWLYEPERKRESGSITNEAEVRPEEDKSTLELVFEDKTFQIPADYNQDTSVFLLPDGRILTYDSIRGDVPLAEDLQVAEKISDVVYPGTEESLLGVSVDELKQKLAAVGRTLVEAK
jgi:hypothetical protein